MANADRERVIVTWLIVAQIAGASLSCPQKSNPQNASTRASETYSQSKKFGSRTFLKVDE
jgi:hypothetical protein